MSVDITRAPYRQSGNIVRDSSTETRLFSKDICNAQLAKKNLSIYE